jgi:hypothetical protein
VSQWSFISVYKASPRTAEAQQVLSKSSRKRKFSDENELYRKGGEVPFI